MRPTDRFMIAPLSAGQETNVRPWLIPDNAFQMLKNAYVFRGRVRKRFGGRLIEASSPVSSSFLANSSRLKINLTTTPSATVPSGPTPSVGQQFSIGNQLFTAHVSGTPAVLLNTTGTVTGTYNTTTGAYVFTGAIGSDIYFYPSTPVLGIVTYQNIATNAETVIAFDRNFAYGYGATGWERISSEAVSGAATWTATDSEFFYATNYRGAESYNYLLFVTNFNNTDGIRTYDGSNWNKFAPNINVAADHVITAKIVIPFKGRLLMFNTVENVGGSDFSFRNRCRFSQAGSPLAAEAWYDTKGSKGGFIDATSKEAIIGAEYLKDRLIVFFEKSTWELVYIGNFVLPFKWQKINTELGAESSGSIIPFDKSVFGIGHVGIVRCSGTNVERLDDKIPNQVFNINNDNDGVKRVHGVRDFYSEMVYWTYPNILQNSDHPFPNKTLVYNYKTDSWAINDDSITVFGYFQQSSNTSFTWETMEETWQSSVETWAGQQYEENYRSVVAGNQQGFTFIVDINSTRNAPSLQISGMSYASSILTLTIMNHNLVIGNDGEGDYIAIENSQGVTNANGFYAVNTVVNKDTITVKNLTFTGVYTGGGTVTRVSNIDILTKQYSFYIKQGYNCSVNKVDFLVDRTAKGQFTVDYFASSSNHSLLSGGDATGSLLGTGILETTPYELNALESSQKRLWHPIYTNLNGECIQLRLYMNEDQLLNSDIAWSEFELHAMTFYSNPTGSRLQ